MSIIGISGKINSGKDTVASIIQYLTSENMGVSTLNKNKPLSDIMTYEEYSDGMRTHNYIKSIWEVKKFAGKLKQIVALLTGCTVEDLEDQEFKNKPLGEEWYKFVSMKPIPIDDIDLPIDQLRPENSIGIETKYEVLTYRTMLQKIGTEAMRDCVHTNCWVNALFSDYNPIHTFQAGILDLSKGSGKFEAIGTRILGSYPNWIISDLRFPNELKAIEDRNGITIRIERLCQKCLVPRNHPKAINGHDPHCIDMHKLEHNSETALDNAKFKYTIDNNESIEELVEKVKEILTKEKII